MSIGEHIYQICGEFMIILAMYMMAHYVFLEPKWSKRQQRANLLTLPILILVEFLVESEFKIFISVLLVGINISFARKKHRIRGFFLTIPILGIYLGMLQFMLYLPEVLTGKESDIYNYIIDIITVIALLLFLWKGKNWRIQFEKELQYRHFMPWEKRLLILAGVLGYIIPVPLSDDMEIEGLDPAGSFSLIYMFFIMQILTITVILVIMQGNKHSYYKATSEMKERYLQAEMEHFKTYQEMQTETRRIRHDMKNHLHILMYLIEQENIEEAKKYLDKLRESVAQTEPKINSGNSFADAICNEKNRIAEKNRICFEIEGKLPENLKMEAIDICTIFANALDNAIEAVIQISDEKKRWMKVEIQNQGDLLFLQFTNPVLGQKILAKGMKTSKKDTINHGFGLQNIRLAAEKYQGTISTEIENTEDGQIFLLEIMLTNRLQQN